MRTISAMRMFDYGYCSCPCRGFILSRRGNISKFISGHNRCGSKISEEHKQKLKKGLKEHVFTDDEKQRRRTMNLGKKLSEEHKRKFTFKGRYHKDETRKKISIAHMGIKPSEETKAKLRYKRSLYSSPMEGKQHSDISKQLIRKARLFQIIPFKDTSIETLVQAELVKRDIIYTKHYPILGQPDIAFPDKKIAIFCDGCYWHNCQECKLLRNQDMIDKLIIKDRRVNDYLYSDGWLVLRYWEHEINANVEAVVDEIEDVLEARCLI